MIDNEGHWIDDPLMVAGVKPDFSGMGLDRHLTDEQKAKLCEKVKDFIYVAVWGYDWEIDEDNFDELIQRELIEPFIEPLINGEL